jgi:hypothetical protein
LHDESLALELGDACLIDVTDDVTVGDFGVPKQVGGFTPLGFMHEVGEDSNIWHGAPSVRFGVVAWRRRHFTSVRPSGKDLTVSVRYW